MLPVVHCYIASSILDGHVTISILDASRIVCRNHDIHPHLGEVKSTLPLRDGHIKSTPHHPEIGVVRQL